MKMKFLPVLLAILWVSCRETRYPNYTLTEIYHLPDSSRDKSSEWIKEALKASGQFGNTKGEVSQIVSTAFDIFWVKEIGLRKKISRNSWEDIKLLPSQMSENELLILDSLSNLR
jgi:hypothetical protein